MEYTEFVKKLFKNYLKQYGYPDIPPHLVILELPSLWNLLVQHNKVPRGISYNIFCQIAVHQMRQERMFAEYYWQTGIERPKWKKKKA